MPAIRGAEGLPSDQGADKNANGYYHYQRPLATPDSQKLSLELGNLVSNFLLEDGLREHASPITPQSAPGEASYNGTGPWRLDPDTLRALRAYIYREANDAQWDEDSLLRRLESAWRNGVRNERSHMLDSTPLFVAMDRTFLTWVELRRHLADLERADKSTYRCSTEARSLGWCADE